MADSLWQYLEDLEAHPRRRVDGTDVQVRHTQPSEPEPIGVILDLEKTRILANQKATTTAGGAQ